MHSFAQFVLAGAVIVGSAVLVPSETRYETTTGASGFKYLKQVEAPTIIVVPIRERPSCVVPPPPHRK